MQMKFIRRVSMKPRLSDDFLPFMCSVCPRKSFIHSISYMYITNAHRNNRLVENHQFRKLVGLEINGVVNTRSRQFPRYKQSRSRKSSMMFHWVKPMFARTYGTPECQISIHPCLFLAAVLMMLPSSLRYSDIR